eukprot:jgi/Undpi1/9398/HiC_scaffold_27.g11855.m1
MSPRRLSTSLEQRPEKEASVGQGGEMASSFSRAGSPYQASREVPQATPACGRGYRQGELPCEETKAGHVERRTRLRVGEGSGGDSGGDVDGEPLPPGLVGELPVLGLPIALPLPSPSPLTRAATIEQKGGLGSMPSPLRRRRSSMKSREQPGFAVVGLVGTYGERVLLLPTGKRKKRLAVGVGAAVAGAVVDDDGEGSAASDAPAAVTWHDGVKKWRVTLTSTKAKPSICNPILALATVLSWARLLPSDALSGSDGTVGVTIPLLSERLGRGSPLPPPLSTVPTSKIDTRGGGGAAAADGGGDGDDGSHNSSDGDDCGEDYGDSNDAAAEDDDHHDGDGDDANGDSSHILSIGAAWMLGHQVFRPSAGGMGGSFAPAGQVGVAAGEAAALRLLSCPDISWAPDPEAVMKALEDGEGSMRAYTVSAFEFDGLREKDARDEDKEYVHNGRGEAKEREHDERKKQGEQDGREEAKENKQKFHEWGSEARAACEELIEFGLCEMSPNGSCLVLRPDVDRFFDLSLKVFGDKHWDADKEMLAHAAMGLIKTGPMTMGLRPPPIHAFLASQKRSSTESLEAPPVYVAGGESAGTVAAGRMRGPMGRLCVKLHSWCLEVRHTLRGGRENTLWPRLVQEGAVPGDANSPRVWNGPMAEALGLLGGWRPENTAAEEAATVSGDKCAWIASLSKKERLLEPTCLRLKEAVAEVLKVVEGLVGTWQKRKMYQEAVALLRLVVRRDQDLAGAEYRLSPDLAWAADWCTSMWRGWAWNRLSVNYETHLKDHQASLDALQSGRDDDCVRGGERVELRQRRAASHRKYDSDDTPPTPQPRRDPEEDIIVDMETRKEGKRKGKNNGRILFFDKRLTVEQVVLRERNQEGGWAGLHCECSLIMFLMVLLLWEEVFDLRAMAAFPHCLANAPLDLYDLHFCERRKGLPKRLKDIASASDEQLWLDVGQRYERYNGVRSAWCNWRRFSKQQALEIAVSFGGRTLSRVLLMLTTDLPHVHCGFPDLVLWRPKRRTSVSRWNRRGRDWRTAEFGLGWQGEGKGWEVQVVEVKSPSDTLSHVQKAWLRELRSAHVPAMVSRVTLKVGGGARTQREGDM